MSCRSKANQRSTPEGVSLSIKQKGLKSKISINFPLSSLHFPLFGQTHRSAPTFNPRGTWIAPLSNTPPPRDTSSAHLIKPYYLKLIIAAEPSFIKYQHCYKYPMFGLVLQGKRLEGKFLFTNTVHIICKLRGRGAGRCCCYGCRESCCYG